MFKGLVKMPELQSRSPMTATQSKLKSFKSRRFTRQPVLPTENIFSSPKGDLSLPDTNRSVSCMRGSMSAKKAEHSPQYAS
jgi:hypothetical protein